MLSAAFKKSIRDLTRRPARAILTVLTLSLAVASVSFFAIPTLIDRTMQDEVREGQLADVTLTMRPTELGADRLAELAALPNVAAVEARNSVDLRVLIGERRARARLIGVRDFAAQGVDVVRVESGTLPGPGEVLSDVQNANVGVYEGRGGDTVTAIGSSGGVRASRDFVVSGRGRSLPGGEQVQDENVIVLYATAQTVEAVSGDAGFSELAFRLQDPSPAVAARTVDAIRGELAGVPGFPGFRNLPQVRAPGEWPGKGELEQFTRLLSVITLLALLSATVLIANTMTTLIAEQTSDIGIMRAIGARSRQVAGVYLRTAFLLGALGAVGGIALGIAISNLLTRSFGQTFWAVGVGFGVDPTLLVASIAVGLIAPALAALPAVRRGLRTQLRVALDASGSATGGGDATDLWIRRAGFLPRAAQIGLRGAVRRKRRSLATVAIVALAVANLLAMLGLASGVVKTTRSAWDDHLEDVRIWSAGRATFDERAATAIRGTPGVAEAQPALVNEIRLGGHEAFVWGVPQEPLFRYRLSDGRWFTPAEEKDRAPVAVIEKNLADTAGVLVGDQLTLTTAAGPARVRVLGTVTNQQENGTVLFVPLTSLRTLLDQPTGTTTYWIKMTSSDEAFVDRTTALIEDRLAPLGYEVGTEITYVAERDDIAANRGITTSITLLGFVIIAISMVGLANAITTTVLERTREIGILRCIGARARDVRRIFTTEGLALGLTGWLLGIPLGYALNRLMVWLTWEIVDVRIPATFPLWNTLIALVGTIALALLVLLLPVRRAVLLRPGDALRAA